jgi:peptide/nickel transport system ATP-binding protein
MYAGTIVEYCDKITLFDKPIHPYTRGLLRATPNIFKDISKLEEIPGSIPDLINPPKGCRFHPRCKFSENICMKEKPPKVSIETDHVVSCHFAEKMWQFGDKSV